MAAQAQISIGTVGHSTHSIDDFIGILEAHGIRQLVDVRTMPRSRRVPQFNSESLAASLPVVGHCLSAHAGARWAPAFEARFYQHRLEECIV